MTSYGLSYFLEDISGSLTPSGSEFVDIYGRMRLSVRRTMQDPTRPVYMIFNTTSTNNQSQHGHGGAAGKPLVALDFGKERNLSCGTVSFPQGTCIPMLKYLVKTGRSSISRRFRASDGQDYCWVHRAQVDQEWACTNSSGHLVAYYSLKPHGEPAYSRSSGCSLTIEEAYPHLAPEFLASLLIMRHIAAHNI